MSMKCEYKPTCNTEAKYRVEIPNVEAGDSDEISICGNCYSQAIDNYEGHVWIVAHRKIFWRDDPWHRPKYPS